VKKLLEKIPLASEEKRIIKLVVIGSLAGCALIVLFVWGIRYALVRNSSQPRPSPPSYASQLAFYSESAKHLLPIDIEAHQGAAQQHLQRENPKKAVEHLLRIMAVAGEQREIALMLATAYLHLQQAPEAIALLEQLGEEKLEDSCSEPALARLGLAYFYQERFSEAVTVLEQCLERYPKSWEAACYLGQVVAALGDDLSRAEELLRRSVALKGDYAEGWYQLGRFTMSRGDYEKSRSYLLQVLALQPLHVRTHSRLGMAYYYLKEFELAEQSYRTALNLNPEDFNTHYNLGELYYARYRESQSIDGQPGERDEARSYEHKALESFKRALEHNPQHTEALFKLGLIALGNNQNREAVRYLERGRVLAPTHTGLLLQLGVAYEKLSQGQEALEVYRAITAYDALNAVALQKIRLLSGK
jgi:tetratricopeptide (TPR) repeat protein